MPIHASICFSEVRDFVFHTCEDNVSFKSVVSARARALFLKNPAVFLGGLFLHESSASCFWTWISMFCCSASGV